MMTTGAAILTAFEQTDDIGTLMALIGCALDYWAVKRDISAETIEDALRGLADASVAAHKAMGMPEKGEIHE